MKEGDLNKVRSENTKLREIIISHRQWIVTIMGIAVIIGGVLCDARCDKVIGTILGQIGSSLLAIGIVAVVYEKWKDKNREGRYFIMNPDRIESGEELINNANIDISSEGKIFLIGRMTEDSFISNNYAFTVLLNKTYFKLLNKDIPLFSYGTTFKYLDPGWKDGTYQKAFENAVKQGLGLNVSIINPISNKIIELENGKDAAIREANNTIQQFIELINAYRHRIKQPIELRLSTYFSPCSFSSISFANGRVVRSLDFNFRHDESRLCQIYDNIEENDNINKSNHKAFSQLLFRRYNRYYQESTLALRYPMEDEITFHILGILEDVVDNSSDNTRKYVKQIICNNDEDLSIISITIRLSDGNELGWQVKRGEKYIELNQDNIFMLFNKAPSADENVNFNQENPNQVSLKNTIVGNVLYEYYLLTGGYCDSDSEEIKETETERKEGKFGYRFDIMTSFEKNADTRTDFNRDNEFVLIGEIVSTPERVIPKEPIKRVALGQFNLKNKLINLGFSSNQASTIIAKINSI